jgi:hypothetical protein
MKTKRTTGKRFLGIIALAAFALSSVLCTLLLAEPAAAFGISPQGVTIQHNESTAGTRIPFTVRTIMDSGESGVAHVRAEGDLASGIVFDKDVVPLGEQITGSILIPETLEPGDHVQEIIITQVPEAGTGTVQAAIELASAIIVQSPYPDAYLTATLTPNRQAGSAVLMTVMLQNHGIRAVTPDAVSIMVFDGAQQRDEIGLVPPTVVPTSFAGVSAMYDGVRTGALQPGEYTVRARIPYEDREAMTPEQSVTFGAPLINITTARYAYEETGAIKPIDVSIRTTWNRPLNGTILVYVDNSTAPSTTQEIPLNPAAPVRLYLDTTVSGVPKTHITIVVRAHGSEASVRIPVTARPVATGPPLALIILCIVAIITIGLLILVWLRGKRR